GAHGLFRGDTAAFLAGQRHRVIAGANGIAPRHQRGARRRALRLRSEVEQLHPLGREGVDAPRVGAAQDAATIATELAIAEIVDRSEERRVGKERRARWAWEQ